MDEERSIANRTNVFADLPLSVVIKIDQLADDFESSWRSGNDPDLDSFVRQIDAAGEAARDALDSHLRQLRTEIESSDSTDKEWAAQIQQATKVPQDSGAMELPPVVLAGEESIAVGEYELLEPLGSGGMGIVYKARHTRLDSVVAIKFSRFVAALDPQSAARFLREAKLIGRLQHPNIVRALDAGESQYGPYLVTEFVDGETVEARVRRTGPLLFETAITLAQQAARALAYAHSQGIVHRDIKPSNMLLDQAGELRVVDFGLAKRHASEGQAVDASQKSEATEFGAFLGTVGYAAPEQLRSDKPVDQRADIYALGCVIYFMLTGEAPHKGTLADRLLTQRRLSASSLSLTRSEVSPGFWKMWQRMVANSQQRRFSSMAELEQAMGTMLADWRKGHRQSWLTRRMVLIASACLSLVVLIGFGATYFRGGDSSLQSKLSGKEPPRAIAPFTPVQAKLHQLQWANYVDKSARVVNSIEMPLVLVPAGEYLMGLSDAPIPEPLPPDDDWRFREPDILQQEQTPQHRVVLTKPVYFSETEVTFAQFRQFIEATSYVTDVEQDAGWGKETKSWVKRVGYSWKNMGQWVSDDRHPVINVTWNDAVAFCVWLTAHDELGEYRLPTEAEWEFACRAGSTTTFYFGNDDTDFPDHAWFKSNFVGQFHPVGLKKPNPFGLYDMYGNRQEWCQDVYALDFYDSSPVRDPVCETGSLERVMRGGAHSDLASFCTSARRWSQKSDNPGAAGFRVVCVLY